jgi:hypothetical protein
MRFYHPDVSMHLRVLVGKHAGNVNFPLVGGELEFLHHVLHKLRDGKRFALRLELMRFEFG